MNLNNKKLNKIKIVLIILLALLVMFVGISALVKAIDAITIKKTIFEVVGFYISLFTLHILNLILKDYIREYRA